MPTENQNGKVQKLVSFLDPRTIRFKLLATVVFSFIAFSTFISYNQTREVFIETKKGLFNSAEAYSELSVSTFGNLYLNFYNSGFLTFANQSTDLLKLNRDIKKVQIVDPSGQILYDSTLVHSGDLRPPETDQKISKQNILDGINSATKILLQDQKGNITQILQPFTDPFGFQPFAILYSIDYQRADQISQNTLFSIVTTSAFSTLAVIFLVSVLLHFLLLSPISKVIFGARRITSGDLNYQIPLKGDNEVANLAEAVNFMAQVLRKDIEDLKSLDKLKDEFIIIASHNLRTPLTAIKGYLDFLKVDLKNIDLKDQNFLERANQATNKLNTLSEELINIVNIKSGQNPLSPIPVEISELVNASLLNFDSSLEQKKITVTKSIGTLPQVLADKNSIESVLNNLLENAIKFSNEGGKIEINAILDKNEVVVSVRDYGVGMTETQISGLFQKFHRGNDLLTYDYEGEGLGLYLNQLIIKNHGGRIWATSKPNEGATFSFSLPISPN